MTDFKVFFKIHLARKMGKFSEAKNDKNKSKGETRCTNQWPSKKQLQTLAFNLLNIKWGGGGGQKQ